MTPEIASVLTRVSEEIEVQLGLLERQGVKYAQQYAECAVRGRGTPAPPREWSPFMARMVRELTLDELVARRRA